MAELLQFPSPIAPASSSEPDDAAERLAALDPRQSFLVEAPAGSGKTALLIQRFLILLAQPEVEEPGQVLALTFTRDATAELRHRVLKQLREAATGTEPEGSLDRQLRPLAEAVLRRDRELGWHLLNDPRRLNIQTIDAVCAEIARSLPVLSGTGGSLRPSEQPEPLFAEAARRTLAQLGGPDEELSRALETLLLHQDADLGKTESLVAEMLCKRDLWAGLVRLEYSTWSDEKLDREVLPQMQHILESALCQQLTRIKAAIPEQFLDELCSLAGFLGHAGGHKDKPSPIAICAGRHGSPGCSHQDIEHWQALAHLLLTKAGEPRSLGGLKPNFLGFVISTDQVQHLADLLDQIREDEQTRKALAALRALPPAEYPGSQWRITKALFRVLARALVELQLVFAGGGRCDFAELSLVARTALHREGAAEDLALNTGEHLQHLLVDEMQDTSSSQYELLHLLTRQWDGHSQTVFLVGDPKQSIYLFREARVERFVEVMEQGRFGDLPLSVLHLTANFRSQGNLVQAFNEDFAAIFASGGEVGSPPIHYRAAAATRPSTEREPRHWHLTTIADAEGRQLQTVRNASTMRSVIEQWRARPLPAGRVEPWRIAVLVRSRAHLAPVIATLREGPEPIPYRSVNIETLGEQQEILDLLALTRALLHPADRTAWLALLRSPLCGLSLHALHTLSGADEDALRKSTLPALLTTRIPLLEPEDRDAAERFRSVMELSLRRHGTLRLSEWVLRTWLTFGANRYLTPDRLDNVERFLELLDELAANSPSEEAVDLPLLAERLEKLYSNPSSVPDAVDLMTIHGAKGLEWDVVLVPSLERSGAGDRAGLLSWLEVPDDSGDGPPEGLLAPIKARGEETEALNQWMGSLGRDRAKEETKRLFYVACTRARQELHLFSATTLKKNGEPSAPAGTLLQAALPAAAPFFEPAAPLPELLSFPAPDTMDKAEPGRLDRLAAAAVTPRLYRIPVSSTLALTAPAHAAVEPIRYARSSGSFAARAFGDTAHALLAQLVRERANGTSEAALQQQLPQFRARIHALLRAEGLSQADCENKVTAVLTLLSNTLADAAGRWILEPHPGATSEQEMRIGDRVLRPDRTFLAGAEPLASGDTHLWIVDYKTSSPGTDDRETFLAAERDRYRPQLEAYATALAGDKPVRLALYYPALPALVVLD